MIAAAAVRMDGRSDATRKTFTVASSRISLHGRTVAAFAAVRRKTFTAKNLHSSKRLGWTDGTPTVLKRTTVHGIRSTLQRQAANVSDEHSKAQLTLAEKISWLQSKGFLVNDCDAAENAFPDFIDLL